MQLSIQSIDNDTEMRLEMIGATENIQYVGLCKAGDIDKKSDTIRRIMKLDNYSAGGTPMLKSYADGDSLFNKVRDDRASYTYGTI